MPPSRNFDGPQRKVSGQKTPKDPRTGKHIDPTSIRSIDPLLAAAKAHGQADLPEHEVGDLIALFTASWLQMRSSQRAYVLGEFEYLLEEQLGD
jgi:hypothetical protein